MTKTRTEAGFSIMELLVATFVLMVISGIVTQALLQLTKAQATIWNRTEMHSGIRGATELLQQEVGQAGRVGVPQTITLTQDIHDVGGLTPAARPSCDPSQPSLGADPVTVSSITGLWATDGPPPSYVNLTILDGATQESVRVYTVSAGPPATVTACFLHAHLSGATVAVLGAFATGIVPNFGLPPGSVSTPWVLKLYGDVNGDGNMVYVEYTCVDKTVGPDKITPGNLSRNVVAWDSLPANKAAGTQILLSNVVANIDPANPAGPPLPCFNYQTQKVVVQGTDMYFVLDVAVTLTVQSALRDPVTGQFQKETKALLNVSPRNVFNAWELASIGYTERIQSMPATVSALLP